MRMDGARTADAVTEWLQQQVDPAFEPLVRRLAAHGTPVRWEQADFARTLRMQVGGAEITYTITVLPDSRPPAGELRFRPPEAEDRRTFVPALSGRPQVPGEMTGQDLVNDLIEQYGQRLHRRLCTKVTRST